jgi:hypothetical protein
MILPTSFFIGVSICPGESGMRFEPLNFGCQEEAVRPDRLAVAGCQCPVEKGLVPQGANSASQVVAVLPLRARATVRQTMLRNNITN